MQASACNTTIYLRLGKIDTFGYSTIYRSPNDQWYISTSQFSKTAVKANADWSNKQILYQEIRKRQVRDEVVMTNIFWVRNHLWTSRCPTDSEIRKGGLSYQTQSVL